MALRQIKIRKYERKNKVAMLLLLNVVADLIYLNFHQVSEFLICTFSQINANIYKCMWKFICMMNVYIENHHIDILYLGWQN